MEKNEELLIAQLERVSKDLSSIEKQLETLILLTKSNSNLDWLEEQLQNEKVN
jgi:hypothetical protein